MLLCFFYMRRLPPRATRTYVRFPYPTRFRSFAAERRGEQAADSVECLGRPLRRRRDQPPRSAAAVQARKLGRNDRMARAPVEEALVQRARLLDRKSTRLNSSH